MGSSFTLGVVTGTQERADSLFHMGIEEIWRLENLLSEFLPHSETSLINKYAGKRPVKVSAETFGLMQRSQDISQLCKGDFDITVSPLKKLYQFKNKAFVFPHQQEIDKVLKCVGFRHLKLNSDNNSVYLTKPGSQISFAAIGKGYASDQVKKLWKHHGVISGYINASGDLTAFGKTISGEPWGIGISNPDNREQMLLHIPLINNSVATSGDYEQHFIYKNIRYSHNINPHTGIPLSGIKSVSVFSPSAELSDALATAVYVKGIIKGIDFIDQLPDTHCVIIDKKNKIHFSKKLKYKPMQTLQAGNTRTNDLNNNEL